MKIALVIYGSLDTVSGGYLYDRKLVEFLRGEGDLVKIISLPWRNYSRHLIDNWSAALRRQLEGLDIDVLLQDELNHPSLFWLNPRLVNRIPRLAIVHHLRISEQRPVWQNRLYAGIERRYLRSVDGFIFNSRTTQSVVAANLPQGAPALQNSLVALPAGDRFSPHITDSEIAARSTWEDPLRLIFLGNLIPRKGLHTLLEALAVLSVEKERIGPTVSLVVIGSLTTDPVYTRRVQQRANQPDLAGVVQFFGPLDDAALAIQLRQAQVLAVPSTYEGYGIAYLEGMSFGLPAIAGSKGAAGEIITNEQDGFLIPSDDYRIMSKIIAGLAKDRQRLLELSLAARRRYLAQPTWAETGERIRKFLENFV